MIHATGIGSAEAPRLTTSVPVWRSEQRTTLSWFDDGGLAVLCIGGNINFAARNLSVEEHTTRVLEHLCGRRDVAA